MATIAFPPLPIPLTPLIGRETEREALAALLRDPAYRLVTVMGPGGAGKTRLALRAGADLAGDFPGGVGFVSLASLPPESDLVAAILATAGIDESGEAAGLDALGEALTDRPALLILDNLEHLASGGELLPALLSRCPGTKVLVTSRAALRVRGEREFALSPLPVPSLTAPPATLEAEPAVALFLALARVDRNRLIRDEQDLVAIAGICRRLDGLPLAIELAAARSSILPPRAMLGKLESRLALLTGGPRDLPERHQTLRGTIAWSYDLLTGDARDLFRAIALLPGGAGLSSIEAVSPTLGNPAGIYDSLNALVEHSLVRGIDGADDQPRYVMLETIREFGVEAAAAKGERAHLERVLGEHLCEMAHGAAKDLGGPEQAAKLAWFAAEQDNLLAAMDWLQAADAQGQALRIGAALGRFWLIRGRLVDGKRSLMRLLEQAVGEFAAEKASVLTAVGAISEEVGDHAGAVAAHTESLRLSRESGDAYGVARAVNNLGLVLMGQRDYQAAREHFEEALKAFRDLKHESAVGVTLINLATVADRSGDPELAHGLLERALAVQRRLGDSQRVALNLQTLGLVATARGELDRADQCFVEAIAIWEQLDDDDSVARTLAHRGRLARLRGDDGAAGLLAAGIERAAHLEDDHLTLAMCCLDLAVIAWQRGERETATRLLGRADELNDWRSAPLRPDERADWERAESALRGAVQKEVFATLHSEGERLTSDWCIGVARRFASEPATPVTEAKVEEAPFGLSPRELDVVRLVVHGMSDKQIGDELFISHRTVMRHVTNILSKMDVSSRTAAAALAVRHGLG